jgi:hypothetical protein
LKATTLPEREPAEITAENIKKTNVVINIE